jgi:hypothetical protein
MDLKQTEPDFSKALTPMWRGVCAVEPWPTVSEM